MKHKIADEVKKEVIKMLNSHYGYCASAESDTKTIIDVGDEETDIRIIIETKPA